MKAYPTTSDPHLCSSANLVLKLSAPTNAHAEIPSQDNYSTLVCYGDLVCTNRDVCKSGEVEVVGLSKSGNAHLSKDSTYSNLICCSSVYAGAVTTGLHWKSMTGDVIDNTVINVNDSVRLTALVQPNTAASIKVYRKTGGVTEVKSFTGLTSDADGNISVIWKINDLAMSGSLSEFYFNASSGDSTAKSSALNVTNPEINTPPSCAILSPGFGGIQMVGSTLNFGIAPNAGDPDSVVNMNWKIINSMGTVEKSSNENAGSYVLTSTGTKLITLSVVDDRGASCYNETGISVARLSAPGETSPTTEVFAWISNPVENQIIQTSSFRISYNAGESYAYNVSGGSCATLSLTCVAGKCPSITVDCSGTPVTMTNTPKDFSALNFGWIFDGVFEPAVSGLDKEDGQRTYTTTGIKTLKVNANYGIANDSKTRKFTVVNGCERPQINTAWVVIPNADGSVTKKNPLTESDICKMEVNDPSDDCCPDGGWICGRAQTSDPIKCIQPVLSAGFCEDYTTQESCSSDTNRVGTEANYKSNNGDLYSLLNCSSHPTVDGNLYTVVCGRTSENNANGCVWNSSTNTCWLRVSYQRHNELGEIVDVPACVYRSTLGECSGGVQSMTVIGESNPNPNSLGVECSSMAPEYTILCGRTGVRLPFFGITQFVVAIIILIIIYLIIKLKVFGGKKNKKNRRKN